MLSLVAGDTLDGIEAFGKCPSFEAIVSFCRVKYGLQVVIILDFEWVTMLFGHASQVKTRSIRHKKKKTFMQSYFCT
jgi:hypothetical protein